MWAYEYITKVVTLHGYSAKFVPQDKTKILVICLGLRAACCVASCFSRVSRFLINEKFRKAGRYRENVVIKSFGGVCGPRRGNARHRPKHAAKRLPPAGSPEARAVIFLPQGCVEICKTCVSAAEELRPAT